MERAIGVFDSGVGGLTVLNSIRTLLPNENIIYIGDNYHCLMVKKHENNYLVMQVK